MVEKWIVNNLKKYGNCVISQKAAKKDIKEMLEELATKGLNCKLDVREQIVYDTNNCSRKKKAYIYVLVLV